MNNPAKEFEQSINQIQTDEVLKSLIEKGLVRVDGQNENGENFYRLTEAGRRVSRNPKRS